MSKLPIVTKSKDEKMLAVVIEANNALSELYEVINRIDNRYVKAAGKTFYYAAVMLMRTIIKVKDNQ